MLFPYQEKQCYVGISWNLDTVVTKIITLKIAGLTEETGLQFGLINDSNINLLTGKTFRKPEESLTLTFTKIPFSWSLIAIQPGYEKLESDAKIQMIIYGLLFVLILILMFC